MTLHTDSKAEMNARVLGEANSGVVVDVDAKPHDSVSVKLCLTIQL